MKSYTAFYHILKKRRTECFRLWNLKRTHKSAEYKVTDGRTFMNVPTFNIVISKSSARSREGILFSPTDKEVRRTNSKETGETKRFVGNCQEFLRSILLKNLILQNNILDKLTMQNNATVIYNLHREIMYTYTQFNGIKGHIMYIFVGVYMNISRLICVV